VDFYIKLEAKKGQFIVSEDFNGSTRQNYNFASRFGQFLKIVSRNRERYRLIIFENIMVVRIAGQERGSNTEVEKTA
jgi:hypothetical protein